MSLGLWITEFSMAAKSIILRFKFNWDEHLISHAALMKCKDTKYQAVAAEHKFQSVSVLIIHSAVSYFTWNFCQFVIDHTQ